MKKLVAVFLLVAMVMTLAACGGAAPAETVALTPTGGDVLPETTAAPETQPEALTPTGGDCDMDAAVEVTVRLGAMTGPTGIGMVKLFKDAEETGLPYTKTIAATADELTPLILQGELDIAAVPSNLASTLYNKTEGGVTALAVNVLGVLYIGEYNSDEIHSVADLKGKTIYAAGQGSVPEYFLRYILSANGIDPDSDVTIEWRSEAAEVVATLNEKQSGIAMLPQPYVTAAAGQLGEGFRIALSVSDEWAALDNGTQCTTAVIMARTAFVEEHPQAVEYFMQCFADSVAWVNGNVEDAAALCGEYDIVKAPVAQKAIPKCNLVCMTGQDMKAALSGCLGVIFDQNPKAVGGALPGDSFYYGA